MKIAKEIYKLLYSIKSSSHFDSILSDARFEREISVMSDNDYVKIVNFLAEVFFLYNLQTITLQTQASLWKYWAEPLLSSNSNNSYVNFRQNSKHNNKIGETLSHVITCYHSGFLNRVSVCTCTCTWQVHIHVDWNAREKVWRTNRGGENSGHKELARSQIRKRQRC